MFNSLRNLAILGLLLSASSGCMMISKQQLDLRYDYMTQEVAKANLQYGFDSAGSGPGGWPFATTIHVPLVLYFEYDRAPWTVWMNVRDTSQNCQTLHVDSVQFSWLGTGEEQVQLAGEVIRFKETSAGYREATYFLEQVKRSEPVEVRIRGRVIRADGSQVPVEFSQTLLPEKAGAVAAPIWFYYAS